MWLHIHLGLQSGLWWRRLGLDGFGLGSGSGPGNEAKAGEQQNEEEVVFMANDKMEILSVGKKMHVGQGVPEGPSICRRAEERHRAVS